MERVTYIHKTFGDAALAEEYIEGREFYVGVLGNDSPTAFPPLEMDFSGLDTGSVPIMDSRAKFDETSDRYHGTTVVVPPREKGLGWLTCGVSEIVTVRALRPPSTQAAQTGEIRDRGERELPPEEHSEFAVAARAHGIGYPELVNRSRSRDRARWKHRGCAQRSARKLREPRSEPIPPSDATRDFLA
jgi:D-alanine-D-alanine ligase